MLGSITPLGQRGRDGAWTTVAASYLIGSIVGGALVGTIAGSLGSLPALQGLTTGAPRLWILAVAAAAAVALDLGVAGLRIPGVHRQVDDHWMYRFRGWVYGVGFGVQLGLGVVTVVTSAGIYLMLLIALLSGSASTGAVIGAVFGLARALPLMAVAGVESSEQVLALSRRLERWRAPARLVAAGASLAVFVLAGALLLAGGAP